MASTPQSQHNVVSFAEVFLEAEALRYSQKDECKQCSTTKQSGVWPYPMIGSHEKRNAPINAPIKIKIMIYPLKYMASLRCGRQR
jgi:hypothetical protein